MKRLLYAVLATLVATGCSRSLTGTLNVREPMAINKKDGSAVSLDQGSYRATLQDKEKKVVLHVEGAGRQLKADIRTPQGLVFPDTGSFSVTSEQSGQPWNLVGQIQTDYKEGPRYRRTERCSYGRNYWYCHWRPGPHRHCGWWYDEFYFGVRQVEYHMETVSRKASVEFRDPRSRQTLAVFNAAQVDESVLVYDYIGSCH